MIKKFFVATLLVLIASGVVNASSETLSPGFVPGTQHRLSIKYIENQSPSSSFKLFYGDSGGKALIAPNSKCNFGQGELTLDQINPVRLICSQGSYVPIYVQDEGVASGETISGYHGPYYLSMWLSYPHVSDEFKVQVRYVVLARKVGEIGVRIGPKGECQIVAIANVKLLS